MLLAAFVIANIVGCVTEVREGAMAAANTDATSDAGSFSGDGTFLIDTDKTDVLKCQNPGCDPNNVPLLDCPEKGPFSGGPFADFVPCGLTAFDDSVLVCECLPIDATIDPPIEACWSKGKEVTKVRTDCLDTTVFPGEGAVHVAKAFAPIAATCRSTGEKVEGCVVAFQGKGQVILGSGEFRPGDVIPLYPADAQP